jgi:hypothetical protein
MSREAAPGAISRRSIMVSSHPGAAQQEEAAAAQARARRLDHGQRGRHGHRGIEGIAALGEDFLAGVAGQWIGAGDGALARARARESSAPAAPAAGSAEQAGKNDARRRASCHQTRFIFLQFGGDQRMHELLDVTAEDRDLAHQWSMR